MSELKEPNWWGSPEDQRRFKEFIKFVQQGTPVVDALPLGRHSPTDLLRRLMPDAPVVEEQLPVQSDNDPSKEDTMYLDSDLDDLNDVIERLQQTVKEQAELIEDFTSAPMMITTVMAVGTERIVLMTPTGPVAAKRPGKRIKGLEPGTTVLVDPASMGVLEVSEFPPTGDLVSVARVIDKSTVEVAVGGQPRKVLVKAGLKPNEGDLALLDPHKVVVLGVVPQPQRYANEASVAVTWAQIGGQEEAKRELQEAVELPLLHSKLFSKFGMRPAKGVLLFGPPGCGKTMLGKAVATSIAARGDGTTGFVYVKAPELLDPYVGVTEAAIRQVFAEARKHYAEHGVPAVVFVDEADALLGRRGERHAHMEKTIVPSFLTEMDGLEESGAIVILATNRADTLDPAVVREGRVDRKVRVARPTKDDATAILKLALKDVPVQGDRKALAQETAALVYDPKWAYCDVLTEAGGHTLTLAGLASGAMLVGVVNQAKSLALHRALANGRARKGVTKQDLADAVHRMFEQNRGLHHGDAILELTQGQQVISTVAR